MQTIPGKVYILCIRRRSYYIQIHAMWFTLRYSVPPNPICNVSRKGVCVYTPYVSAVRLQHIMSIVKQLQLRVTWHGEITILLSMYTVCTTRIYTTGYVEYRDYADHCKPLLQERCVSHTCICTFPECICMCYNHKTQTIIK